MIVFRCGCAVVWFYRGYACLKLECASGTRGKATTLSQNSAGEFGNTSHSGELILLGPFRVLGFS
jgi:hypothetical protein